MAQLLMNIVIRTVWLHCNISDPVPHLLLSFSDSQSDSHHLHRRQAATFSLEIKAYVEISKICRSLSICLRMPAETINTRPNGEKKKQSSQQKQFVSEYLISTSAHTVHRENLFYNLSFSKSVKPGQSQDFSFGLAKQILAGPRIPQVNRSRVKSIKITERKTTITICYFKADLVAFC